MTDLARRAKAYNLAAFMEDLAKAQVSICPECMYVCTGEPPCPKCGHSVLYIFKSNKDSHD